MRCAAEAVQRHDDVVDGEPVAVHLDRRRGQPGRGISCGSTPTPPQCNADTALGTLNFGSSTAELCQLVSVNGSSCSNGTLSTAALVTSLNVLQILTTEALVANGTNPIDLGVSLGITGVSKNAKLTLGLITPRRWSSDPLGAVASTAQIQRTSNSRWPVACSTSP